MTQSDRPQDPFSTVIYDDRCRLCVSAKQGIEKFALEDDLHRVRFLPYASKEAEQSLGSYYCQERPEVAFLISPDGGIQRGLDAFIPLLPGIKGGRFFLAILRIPLVKPLLNLAYRYLARHRYRWFGEVPSQTP